MPTKTTKPAFGLADGYVSEDRLSNEAVDQLAEILGCDARAIRADLDNLARRVFIYRYSKDNPGPQERQKALTELAKGMDGLLNNLRQLDPQARHAIALAYSAGRTGRYAIGAARARYQDDIAALNRLYQNIAVAAKGGQGSGLTEPKALRGRGRPAHHFEVDIAERVIAICEKATGKTFSKSTRSSHHHFAMTALKHFGIEQATARRAISLALEKKEGEKQ